MKQITLNLKTFNEKKSLLGNHLQPLKEIISNKKLIPNSLPKSGGIYAFWWIGDNKRFIDKIKKCDYKLKGKQPKGELISVSFTDHWLKTPMPNNNICLYIGKSTKIKGRISKHLKLSTPNIWKNSEGNEIPKNTGLKPNTESQLRIGLEKVFDTSILDEIINNIAVSWIEIEGYENGINRFYLEDYFIGKYFPIFNIDIER